MMTIRRFVSLTDRMHLISLIIRENPKWRSSLRSLSLLHTAVSVRKIKLSLWGQYVASPQREKFWLEIKLFPSHDSMSGALNLGNTVSETLCVSFINLASEQSLRGENHSLRSELQSFAES